MRPDPDQDTHLPVVQPNPLLEERPVGPVAIALTTLMAAAIVVLVLYGVTQDKDQVASTPPAASEPSTTGQAPAAQPPASQASKQDGDKPATPPAAGGNATATTGGPSARPAPQAREAPPQSAPAEEKNR